MVSALFSHCNGGPLAQTLVPEKTWKITLSCGRYVVFSDGQFCDMFEWAMAGNLAKYVEGNNCNYSDINDAIKGIVKFHRG